MRLTAIRLAGFKSFVDRTELRLSSNLTAIVGPNGCGKSNLIDAVRWVLGESSARQLRGSSLEDVIFTGSRTRKPVGRASIELVFDNSEGTHGGQWGAYAEIAVRRELTRDGQSTFFVNNQKCRRKDVTELFLGTGLGPRANYAIIEQGTISRLVEAQPDDLRQMLEEAAGVSKYKEKRRETETRIRHTRENLERLHDLISEIDERVARLKRQVSAARRYKEYRAEQRAARASLFGLRWQDLARQRDQGDERVASAESAVVTSRQALTEAMVQQQTTEETLEQTAALGRSADEAYYASKAELDRIEQELRHQQQMRNVRQQELDQLRAEAERLQGQLQTARTNHIQADEKLTAIDAEISGLSGQEVAAESRHADTGEALNAAQARLLEARKAVEGPRTEQAREQARREQLQRQLQQVEQRHLRLNSELEKLRANPPLDNLDELEVATTQAGLAQEAAQTTLEQAGTRLEEARERVKGAESESREAGAQLAQARARFNVLQAEQERSLGIDEVDSRRRLQDLGVAISGVLGEMLRVPSGREIAIEAVLGDWLRSPVVDRLPEPLPVGSSVLVGAATKSDAADQAALSWDVSAPPAVLQILAQYRFCADASEAKNITELGDSVAAVTATGELFWKDAARGRKSEDEQGGVLLRQKALAEAEAAFALATTRSTAADEDRQKARESQKSAESSWADAGRALEDARRARARADEQLVRAQAQRERFEKAAADAEQAVANATQDAQQLQSEIEAVESRLQESVSLLQNVSAAAGEAESAWRQIQQDNASAQQSAQQLRRQVAQLRQQREELARRRAAAESAVASREQGLAQIQLGTERAQAALAELPADEATVPRQQKAKSEFQACSERRKQAQTQITEATELRQRAQHALDAARQQNESAISKVQELRLERERLASRQESLQEQMDEHSLSPQRAVDAIQEGQTLASVQEQLEGLERKLARLGPVNLAAVEEYEEESKRAEELRAQDADLNDALEQLESAMAQIDKETRTLFRQTYNQVNEGFQRRFPVLFGGGEAGLELIGDDLLSSGVRVMARPPGKRNASIALLSGGEKALTAVALVFALFELNPAPFCMLDEVDAPLDDANVVRFCDVVKEMSAQVQFIVVTHNKVTMEMADALHGVTQQEAGVSRLVGVDVGAAVAMTENSA